MRAALLISGLLLSCFNAMVAQITEVATLTGRYEALRSLETAGPKFIQRTTTGFTLYEPDLSTYQSATYPAAPLGYNYGLSPMPQYITESLFDTDPGTIEYLILLFRDDYAWNGTVVARIDGTVLLLDTLHGPGGVNGLDLFSSAPSIFRTDLGPRLILNQGISTSSRIYALPGELPCFDCTHGGMGGDELAATGSHNAIALYPNPATRSVRVDLGMLIEDGPVTLRVQDIRGRLVGVFGPTASARLDISVESFAPGPYEMVAIGSHGALAPPKIFLVQH